jgi:hypothetical protein
VKDAPQHIQHTKDLSDKSMLQLNGHAVDKETYHEHHDHDSSMSHDIDKVNVIGNEEATLPEDNNQ